MHWTNWQRNKRRLAAEPLEDRRLLSLSPFPTPLFAAQPLGSMVYRGAANANLAAAGETDSFTIDLDDGQTLSVVARPDAAFEPTIELKGPSGAVLGSAMASAPGKDAILQVIPTQGAGTYTITVGGEAGGTGGYAVELVLNAAVEMEEHGGIANNAAAAAQDISGAFQGLGLGTGDRGAVVGSLPLGNEDWYRFTLADGQTATLAVSSTVPNSLGLELYDGQGFWRAAGIPAGNADRMIASFTDATGDGLAGSYYARVVGAVSTSYALWVTRGAIIEIEPNEAPSAQAITLPATIAGNVDPGLTPEQWAEQQRITLTNAASSDYFGQSVAVSGDRAIVGAPGRKQGSNYGAGEAVVFRFDGTRWLQDTVLAASDGKSYDAFGTAVSIDGDYAIVSAPGYDSAASDSGASYIYHFNGTQWVEEQKLTASDAATYDHFGSSVHLSGDLAIVGVPDDSGSTSHTGSAWIFRRKDGVWIREQKLTAPNEGILGYFGRSVKIAAGRAFVSEERNSSTYQGNVYIFGYDGSAWTLRQTISADDGASSDKFGQSLVIEGDLLLVGATGAKGGGQSSAGAAYLFRFDGAAWLQRQKFEDPQPQSSGELGSSVAIAGGDVLIGASRKDVPNYDSGAVYRFHFNGIQWGLAETLVPSNLATAEQFGAAIAASGSRALIGAFREDGGYVNTGAVYAFQFGQRPVIVPDDYVFSVRAGELVRISTATPGGSSGEPINFLDPKIELYSPTGLVASNDNGAPDGRNATLLYQAAETGSYHLRITAAGGVPGEYLASVDAKMPAEIRGRSWYDLDADGLRDAGENRLGGWMVYLDANENGQLDTGEMSTTTAPDGTYAFGPLWPDTHTVAEVVKAGWQQTFPAASLAHRVTVGPGQVVEDVDFGNYTAPAAIRGRKWSDWDGDGVWDAGEAPLAGWEIYLDMNRNRQYDADEPRTTTDAQGQYAFEDLVFGDYRVAETQQPTWQQTFPTTFRLLAGTSSGIIELRTEPVAEIKIGGSYFCTGLDFEPSTGTLYATSSSSTLATIDTATGAIHNLGTIHSGTQSSIGFHSIAFHPDGTLYGLAAGNDLYTIDRTTLVATLVGHVSGSPWGIDFAPDGKLYAGFGTLYQLDPKTGATVATIGSMHVYITDLDFAPDGFLYGTDSGSKALYRINPATAATTVVGTYQSSTWEVASELLGHHDVTLAPGQTAENLNFGNHAQPGEVRGTVWRDMDGDGVRDADDPALAGWTVFLDYNGDGNLDPGEKSTTTDSAGAYVLTQVPAGEHAVAQFVKPGWQQTSPANGSAWAIHVEPAQVVTGVDFGNFIPPGELRGGVWLDTDIDGAWDAGENGLAGWTVFLDANGNGQLDAAETSATTAADGSYAFKDLLPGSYTIAQVLQAGWQQTRPSAALAYTVNVSAGQTVANLDFGNRDGLAEVHGSVWQDSDGDATWDTGEPPLAGWTAYLDGNGNKQLDSGERSATTDAVGAYDFRFVEPGSYTLVQVVLPRWNQTFPGAGAGHALTLGAGQNVTGLRFGNQQALPEIRGTKWSDLDGDGARDSGEPGVEGWKIFLDTNYNGQWDTDEPYQLTDANGDYAFIDVAPGSYQVAEESRTGWQQTYPGLGQQALALPPAAALTDASVLSAVDDALPVPAPAGHMQIEAAIPSSWHMIPTYQSVPEYIWHYGCSPTAAGMLFGWWDAQPGTTDLFQGSAATWWGDAGESPAGGTKSMVASNSHIVAGRENGYTYGDWHNSPSFPAHQTHPASLADFMKTVDGGTYRSDMAAGFVNFAAWDSPWTPANESYTATATTYYTSSGWTFDDFRAEIDRGYPVHLGITGHSIVAMGYWDQRTPNDPNNYGYVCYTTWSGWGLTQWRWDGQGVPDSRSVYGGTYLRVASRSQAGTHQVTVARGQDAGQVDFGNHPLPGEIRGTVWHDFDGNGARDNQDTALAGWTVYLDANQNGQLNADETSTTTDVNGDYAFTALAVGDYAVAQALPADWQQTVPADGLAQTIHVGAGQSVSGVDFGNYIPPGEIRGQVWEDQDADGVLDAGEPGLAGWTVFLDADANGQLDANETVATTEAGGSFAFTDLMPGTYTVAQVSPAGWEPKFPNSRAHSIIVAAGQTEANVDFGNYPPPGEIRGRLWHDADGDRTWDADELPLEGWTVYLDANGNDQLDQGEVSVLSDGSGAYAFTGLHYGAYRVAEILPADWQQTTPGGPPAYSLNLTPAEVVANLDFGNWPTPGEIRGGLWHDRDANGVRDAGEPILAGWTVYLDADSNGQLDPGEMSTTASSRGEYVLTRVPVGAYKLAEVLVRGWQQQYPGGALVHNVTITPGLAVNGMDFGNRPLAGEIRGQKWNDVNGNGVQDAGEPALAGWTVYLDANRNGQLDAGEPPTVTDADGRYAFTGLEIGLYTVAEAPQAGWQQTYPSQPNLEWITYGMDGLPGNAASNYPRMSADGRYLVYYSSASNLVPGDTNTAVDVFVFDRHTGLTERISMAPDGSQLVKGASATSISEDGRYVAFRSSSTNLVPNDNNGQPDIFVLDRQTGLIECASLNGQGQTANGDSTGPIISDDGRYVVYSSTASDLVPGDAGYEDVFVYDRLTKAVELVSPAVGGQPATGDSDLPVISEDGRYVAFQSLSSNLVSGDTNSTSDVFVFDRQNRSMERVSLRWNGTQTTGSSFRPWLSPDGRYVAFHSWAASLVTGDTNSSADAFLYDRQAKSIQRINLNADGSEVAKNTKQVSLSDDGRYAVYMTYAGLISDQEIYRIVVRDCQTGAVKELSLPYEGTSFDGSSESPSISDDGRYILFHSTMTNLVPGDNNAARDIFGILNPFLWNAGSYSFSLQPGEVVDGVNFGNWLAPGEIHGSLWRDRDANGVRDGGEPGLAGWTVFLDTDSNVALDAGETSTTTNARGEYVFSRLPVGTYRVALVVLSGWRQQFPAGSLVHDVTINPGQTVAGMDFGNSPLPGEIRGQKWNDVNGNGVQDAGEPGLTGWTVYLDANRNGQLDADELSTVTDADGNYAFAGLPVGEYTVAEVQQPGWQQPSPSGANLEWVSYGFDALPGTGDSRNPRLSGDGRYVVYFSWASNLVPGDTNNQCDVFVFDRLTGTTERVSMGPDGSQLSAASFIGSISGDGRYLAVRSFAPNLVPNDHNNLHDIFVFDRETGQIEGVSLTSQGKTASGDSTNPVISADGRYVAFMSAAPDMVSGDTGYNDIFLYDRQLGTIELASAAMSGQTRNGNSDVACLSADGRYVAFQSAASNLVPGDTNSAADIFVYDRLTKAVERVSVTTGGAQANGGSWGTSISEDGRYVAFHSVATNLVANDTNGTYDVFVYDRQTKSIERVSVDAGGAQRNGASKLGLRCLSADGRYVVYSTWVSNVAGQDVYKAVVYDRQTGQVKDLSVPYNAIPLDGTSESPSISADGQYITFFSSATNLVPGDTNGVMDVFATVNPLAWTAGTYTLSLRPGQVAGQVNFGNHPLPGSISGFVWSDQDGNGEWDAAERPLEGWTVFLDANANGQLDSGETSATTDAAGAYAFANLTMGAYTVAEIIPAQWRQTFPGGTATHIISVAPGQSVADVRFGNFSPPGEIRGSVWDDQDRSRTRNGSEPGLAGWTVFLDTDGDGQFDAGEISALTDASGVYAFANLSPRSYHVATVIPGAWEGTFPETSPLPGGASGTIAVTVAPTQVVSGVDFGRRELAYDQGDAPDSYATTLARGGASHHITAGLYLGSGVDQEVDGRPSADALGDDADGAADDEDGMTFVSLLVPGELATIQVAVSAPGKLDGWIDFDGDGRWSETADQVFANQPVAAGSNTLTFMVPDKAAASGRTFARFRVSSTGGLSWTGVASDGEVEDYQVVVQPPVFRGGLSANEFIFSSDGATHTVTVDSVSYTLDASVISLIRIDGRNATDYIAFYGGPGTETAALRMDGGTIMGPGYTLSLTEIESIGVSLGPGSNQVVTIEDGPETDNFISEVHSDHVSIHVNYPWFRQVGVWGSLQTAEVKSTHGGNDVASFHDGPGNDTFVGHLKSSTLDYAIGGKVTVTGFANVYAYANYDPTDTGDTADLYDAADSTDQFLATPASAKLVYDYLKTGGPAGQNWTQGFNTVVAHTTPGSTDVAQYYDSAAADDTFTSDAAARTSSMTDGATYSNSGEGFKKVYAWSSGGVDLADIRGTTGADAVVAALRPLPGNPTSTDYAYLTSSAGTIYTYNFAHLKADMVLGAIDKANLVDSADADQLTVSATQARLASQASSGTYAGRWIEVNHISSVYVTGGSGTARDTATLADSTGNDIFWAQPKDAHMAYGTGQYVDLKGFAEVAAAANAGGADTAYLHDSPTAAANDTLAAGARMARMSDAAGTYVNAATGFGSLFAYSRSGQDAATLSGSAGNDVLTIVPGGYAGNSGQASAIFKYQGGDQTVAFGFRSVEADGGEGGADDIAYVLDSPGDDIARLSQAIQTMETAGNDAHVYAKTAGFDQMYAKSYGSGRDTAWFLDTAGNDFFFGSRKRSYFNYPSNSGDGLVEADAFEVVDATFTIGNETIWMEGTDDADFDDVLRSTLPADLVMEGQAGTAALYRVWLHGLNDRSDKVTGYLQAADASTIDPAAVAYLFTLKQPWKPVDSR